MLNIFLLFNNKKSLDTNKKQQELNKEQLDLNEEIIEQYKNLLKTKQPVYIGKVSRYKDEDIALLEKSPLHLDIILSYFEYLIAVKTDYVRDGQNTQEKIGGLNMLHECYTFFFKLKNKPKEKNTGQEGI